jgi:hypothetical protein
LLPDFGATQNEVICSAPFCYRKVRSWNRPGWKRAVTEDYQKITIRVIAVMKAQQPSKINSKRQLGPGV